MPSQKSDAMAAVVATEGHEPDIQNRSTWGVAVFAARESVTTLEDVVRAVVTACQGHPSRVDVLVNGNRGLAIELAQQFKSQPINTGNNILVYIWFIALGDKAQTWNTYVHRLYKETQLTFFIDGYTRPDPRSLNELAMGLTKNYHALASTGVPSCGRSADQHIETMLREGGLQGGLFALSYKAMNEIRLRKFKLPMGLYRVDSVIGAVINFNFDPSANNWDTARIQVQPQATYYYEALKWWRVKDIISHIKRKRRQAQGVLENLAVRDHLAHRRKAPQTLPRTSRDLVNAWWSSPAGPPLWQIFWHPTWLLALLQLRADRDWSLADQAPEIVTVISNSQEPEKCHQI
jgi:hypothetical protein